MTLTGNENEIETKRDKPKKRRIERYKKMERWRGVEREVERDVDK